MAVARDYATLHGGMDVGDAVYRASYGFGHAEVAKVIILQKAPSGRLAVRVSGYTGKPGYSDEVFYATFEEALDCVCHRSAHHMEEALRTLEQVKMLAVNIGCMDPRLPATWKVTSASREVR